MIIKNSLPSLYFCIFSFQRFSANWHFDIRNELVRVIRLIKVSHPLQRIRIDWGNFAGLSDSTERSLYRLQSVGHLHRPDLFAEYCYPEEVTTNT